MIKQASSIFLAVLMGLGSAEARAADSPAAPSAVERARLQGALEAAQANVFADHGLDAAYELLAVADSATRANAGDVAKSATDALLAVVERATVAGETDPSPAAQDAIDQMLDLKFSASASGLEVVLSALDGAMRRLITTVEAAQVDIANQDEDAWEQRLDALTALADLQASAAQANLSQEADRIGRSFDRAFAALSEDAHNVSGADRIAALDAVRTAREERLADAANNNVQSVAAELRAAEQVEHDESGAADFGGLDLDGQMEDSTCVETGLTEAVQGQGVDVLERECMLSGHATSAGRCPTRDLSFVCYKADAGSESLTYVYRGTPEEDDLRNACGIGNILESMSVPADGAPFRNSGTKLALTCAPIGERAGAE